MSCPCPEVRSVRPALDCLPCETVSLEFVIAVGVQWNAMQNRLSGAAGLAEYAVLRNLRQAGRRCGAELRAGKTASSTASLGRFHLAYHRETKDVKGYALVAAKGGAKLKVSKEQAGFGYILNGRILTQNRNVGEALASMLALPLGQPVVDETGLKGNFDFDLNFAADGRERFAAALDFCGGRGATRPQAGQPNGSGGSACR